MRLSCFDADFASQSKLTKLPLNHYFFAPFSSNFKASQKSALKLCAFSDWIKPVCVVVRGNVVAHQWLLSNCPRVTPARMIHSNNINWKLFRLGLIDKPRNFQLQWPPCTFVPSLCLFNSCVICISLFLSLSKSLWLIQSLCHCAGLCIPSEISCVFTEIPRFISTIVVIIKGNFTRALTEVTVDKYNLFESFPVLGFCKEIIFWVWS